MHVTIQRVTTLLTLGLTAFYYHLLYYGIPFIFYYVVVARDFDLSWPEIIVIVIWIAMCWAKLPIILQWYKEYFDRQESLVKGIGKILGISLLLLLPYGYFLWLGLFIFGHQHLSKNAEILN